MTSAALTWTVRDHLGRTVVALHGDLALDATGRLRTALLKCLAEQPGALLLDLSAVRVANPSALTVFLPVARQAAVWPGVPVLLCAAPPALARQLTAGGYRRLPLRATVDDALRSLDTGEDVLPVVSDQLLPIRGAARHARNLVTEACARWSLPHLIGPAGLVASEFVANVIDHAGTMMTLRISHRDRYLHLTVRDGSSGSPVLKPLVPGRPGASGLGLVDELATKWGWLPTSDGKVTWATFRTA